MDGAKTPYVDECIDMVVMVFVHSFFAYFCKRQLTQPLRNEAFKSHISSTSSRALHLPLATGQPEKTMFSGVSLVLGAARGLSVVTTVPSPVAVQ